ncbi:MAG: hypothetical protein WDM89_02315 [Rhizomicrobium sp.]
MALLRACRDHLLSERERWPLWLPVGFGAGIGLYFWLPVEPFVVAAIATGVLGLTSAILSTRQIHVAFRCS